MIITYENYRSFSTGAKAKKLFQLIEQGYLVPAFFCVNKETSEKEIMDYMDENFPETAEFSVRSSASVEDGQQTSFAGQFQTFLSVPRNEVINRIKDVMEISCDKSLSAYCKSLNVPVNKIRMTVIVQEMIHADISGIIFTANPQGILNEMVIVAGEGTGDNVVEDKTDTTTYYYNWSDALHYYVQNGDAPLLDNKEFTDLVEVSGEIMKFFETPCDIEFAIWQKKIYILQTRPITAMDRTLETIVLDNSNIVESYPGITLPLTQSFVREVYYQVFKSCLFRLTHDKKTVSHAEGVLQNMVDMANGRVYYRISNWYDIILFLPFSRKIIPVWQEMLGVTDKTVSSGLEYSAGFCTRVKTTISFFLLLMTNLKKMDKLDRYFGEVLDYFHTMDVNINDNGRLLGYYQDLKKRVTDQWDLTLVNDMYSFIFTGLLKAWLKAKGTKDYEMVTNSCISGMADIESLKPVRELALLARRAVNEKRMEELKHIRTNEEFYIWIKERQDDFTKELSLYIEQFGDRNLEELKLESKTFRSDPVLLVQRIIQYANDRVEVPEMNKKPAKIKGLTGFLAKKAAAGIRNREKSRLNRSRLYGIMRLFMIRAGENFYEKQRIDKKDDIFWLYYDEIEAAVQNQDMELTGIIKKRKQEYEYYRKLPAYSRLVFSGKVWNKRPEMIKEMDCQKETGIYYGLACSHGIAEGEVLIVEQPCLQMETRNKILVTKMTDPGWAFLIAGAKAVIAEKGSLLSHTAIVSRELGKPAVVGIAHITKKLKNGDFVRVDGDKGKITVISAREKED